MTRHLLIIILVLPLSILSQEVSIPYSEDFETATTGSPGTLPTSWQQVTEGTTDGCTHGNTNCFDWAVRSGTTPSSSTGPSADLSGGSGNYLYVEASGNGNPSVELLSPSFDLSRDLTLEFWTHSYNGSNNAIHTLHIDLVDENNTSVIASSIQQITDTERDEWVKYSIDLSGFTRSSNGRIRFRWEQGTADFRLDHALDNFSLFETRNCGVEGNYRDEFASATYNNSNGSLNWTSNSWVEQDDDGSASGGDILITGGAIQMDNITGFGAGATPSIERAVDLSDASYAELSFRLSEFGVLEGTDVFEVAVFDGTAWNTVLTLTDDFFRVNAVIDITQYANANTIVRFEITSFYGGGDEQIFIDNVNIDYCSVGASLSREVYLEAECGDVGNAWFSNPEADASNLFFIEPRIGQNSLGSAPLGTDDRVRYTFSVDTTANYAIFGRTIAPTTGDNSFWVRVNEGTWYRWNDIPVTSTWDWSRVHDSDNGNTPIDFALTAGTNTLDIAFREDGTRLDKLLVSLSGTTPVGQGGAAFNCITGSLDDTDGDGIVDGIDLDDDNDGILDTDESPASIDFSGTRTLLVGSSITNMVVGDIVVYSDAIRDCDDIFYDIVIEITGLSTNATSEAASTGINLDGIATPADDRYVTFNIRVVERGSATTTNTQGTLASITDFVLEQRDIDSNNGTDATEVVGFSNSTAPDSFYFDPFTIVEQGGFVNGGGPGSNFTYFRMIPLSGTNNWTANDGFVEEDNESAVFLFYETFSSVDVVFGQTGSDVSSGTRFTRFQGSKECDRDGDGVPNRIDLDLDNDGIYDIYEAGHSELDTNNDGRIDFALTGSGTNGLYDSLEILIDGGQIDYTLSNSDTDGIEDFFDRDSDGDNCFDTEEADVIDPDNDGIAGSGTAAADVNGLVISIVYQPPPTRIWQDSTSGCLEICDNGIDDDDDGLIDDTDPDCANYFLEAECGFPGDNWNRGFDTQASNNDYLVIRAGLNSLANAPTSADDLVRFTVNISAAGLYRILGRVYSTSGVDDSFWFRVDEGTWFKWNDWNTASTWEWIVFTDNDDGNTQVKYNLGVGNHTIDIAYREEGARIDKLHLTINGSTPTGEGESAINCGRTITYNLFLPHLLRNK
ncbi:MAG: choice-of-anchor J domain-containing protein [Bacteroidota bacterium]